MQCLQRERTLGKSQTRRGFAYRVEIQSGHENCRGGGVEEEEDEHTSQPQLRKTVLRICVSYESAKANIFLFLPNWEEIINT